MDADCLFPSNSRPFKYLNIELRVMTHEDNFSTQPYRSSWLVVGCALHDRQLRHRHLEYGVAKADSLVAGSC